MLKVHGKIGYRIKEKGSRLMGQGFRPQESGHRFKEKG
jgi:hypothetical protein